MNNSAISTLIVVLPCYNEEEVLNETAKELSDHIRNLIARHIIDSKSKICFVNDGSKDSTWSLIQKLCAEDSLVWGINLAHNRGHQNALLAGLFSVKEYADCVITMDADLQHDIYAIEDFIEKYREGNDIVYGVRKKRMYESFVKKIFSSTYYKIMSYFGAELIPESADYRLMSKKAISALMEYKESNLFLRGIIPTIGLPHSIVEYEQKERIAGESKYPFKKMVQFAITGITSLTDKPLSFIFAAGGFILVTSIILFATFWGLKLFGRNLSVNILICTLIWFGIGINLFSIGLIGIYIGKVYKEVKNRPRFFIQDFTHNS